MAKITQFSPTPEVEAELSKLMKVTKMRGSQAYSAQQHPLLHHAPAQPVRWPKAFDMDWVGRSYAQSASYNKRRTPPERFAAETTAMIQARDWSDERFLVRAPFRDQLEVCEPTHVRDMARATNPYDPAEIKPTWCSYRNTVFVKDYDPTSGMVPTERPSWRGSTDADGWFRDTAFRQRALYFNLSKSRSQDKKAPVLIQLTGTIEVLAESAGAVTWFTPAVNITYGPEVEHLYPAAKPMPYAYRDLVQRNLAIPGRGFGWWHQMEVNWIFNITPLRKLSISPVNPIVRLTLAAMPSFGRYHARNAWAEGTAQLDATVIVPRR